MNGLSGVLRTAIVATLVLGIVAMRLWAGCVDLGWQPGFGLTVGDKSKGDMRWHWGIWAWRNGPTITFTGKAVFQLNILILYYG